MSAHCTTLGNVSSLVVAYIVNDKLAMTNDTI